MENKLKCEIVQDLLPLYAEGLTSEVTKDEIDKHLKECSDCTKIWTDIRSDSQISSKTEEKKQIHFMKKANRRVWKAVGITLSCIAVFAGIFIYSCWWGVGVKKDDLIIKYSYDEYTETSTEYSNVAQNGPQTVKQFDVNITLKNGSGLFAHSYDPGQSNTSAMVAYNMRKVNPFMMTFGDSGADAKSFTTGGHYVIDPDDEDDDSYLDDCIILRCSDGDIVITMREIMENAQ